MCQIILDKLFVKFQQFLKMEHLKLPSYLNTLEKYNEMIRATDTVKKYEEVFYNLLGDESLPLLDILTLMRCIERDVILVHGINDVTHLLELTESFCRGITWIHRSPSRPSHSYGLQPHSLIFMSTLYKATCCLPASS